MENEEDKNEKKHHNYLENFLTKGNYKSFRKMLNLEPHKMKRNKNKIFINNIQTTKLNQINKNHNYLKISNILNLNEDLSKYDYEPYFLERHFDFVDERYRDKSLRGNYEQYSMNYNQIKKNLAKRKGISYDNFRVPKIESYIKQIYENQYISKFFMKNKEINNNITPYDVLQRKHQNFITSFNSNLKNTYILPKINTNINRVNNMKKNIK